MSETSVVSDALTEALAPFKALLSQRADWVTKVPITSLPDKIANLTLWRETREAWMDQLRAEGYLRVGGYACLTVTVVNARVEFWWHSHGQANLKSGSNTADALARLEAHLSRYYMEAAPREEA